jgi:Zn-dependent protease with chaperone function
MKRNHSRGDHLDLYQQVRRNRLKLAFSFSLYFAAAMAFSGVVIFLVFSRLPFPSLYFWIALVLFWTSFFLYCLLRYALGGQWVLKKVKTLPTHRRDRRLDNALASVLLASGMRAKVRLKEIPHSDINAFSLSLPDGSFLLFSTRGVAEKLSASEREAVMAHEVAHMQAGDALLHTALLRLAGTRNMASLPGGWKPGKTRTRWTETSIPPVFLLVFLALLLASMLGEIPIDSVFYPLLSMAALFLAMVPLFPFLLRKSLQLFLDREREYAADLQAVFYTRDPAAVYNAVKEAAEDVRDVLLLPPCLDALLFHPVVDFISYRPFRTQPTMQQRLERLRSRFPALDASSRAGM